MNIRSFVPCWFFSLGNYDISIYLNLCKWAFLFSFVFFTYQLDIRFLCFRFTFRRIYKF